MANNNSMRQWIRFVIDGIHTAIYRKFLRDQGEEGRLRRRIHERIRRLGRTYEDGNSDLIGYTYHPIPFEGFGTVRSHRAMCESRLRAILDNLVIEPGDWVLDIGANVGYFAFSLARLGALVEAYEVQSDTFEIGAALSKLHEADVLFINKAMSTATLRFLRPHYRVTLLLSIFHWIVKQEGEVGATQLLQDLCRRSEALFFEAPCNEDDAMYKHHWFSTEESCEEFLQTALPFAQITRLQTDDDWQGRILWMIKC
jgi:hypothetical protein